MQKQKSIHVILMTALSIPSSGLQYYFPERDDNSINDINSSSSVPLFSATQNSVNEKMTVDWVI